MKCVDLVNRSNNDFKKMKAPLNSHVFCEDIRTLGTVIWGAKHWEWISVFGFSSWKSTQTVLPGYVYISFSATTVSNFGFLKSTSFSWWNFEERHIFRLCLRISVWSTGFSLFDSGTNFAKNPVLGCLFGTNFRDHSDNKFWIWKILRCSHGHIQQVGFVQNCI